MKTAKREPVLQPEPTVELALAKLDATVERFDKTVSRLVVAMERYLEANDAERNRARRALAKLHPEMDRIEAEVQAKMERLRGR